jgi:acyl-CoA thioesterase-1
MYIYRENKSAHFKNLPLVYLLALLILSATVRSADPPVILVMGDSLSSAHGLTASQGWVSLLEERLEAHGHVYRVVNASITGDTTRGGLARLPKALDRHKPSLIIIELGGNDGLRGIQPRQMQKNITEMVELSRRHGSQVLLVGVRLPANYGEAFTQRFEAVYRKVAENTGVALLPFLLKDVAEHPSLFQSDGIHPSSEAQEIILDNVWTALVPLL